VKHNEGAHEGTINERGWGIRRIKLAATGKRGGGRVLKASRDGREPDKKAASEET